MRLTEPLVRIKDNGRALVPTIKIQFDKKNKLEYKVIPKEYLVIFDLENNRIVLKYPTPVSENLD